MLDSTVASLRTPTQLVDSMRMVLRWQEAVGWQSCLTHAGPVDDAPPVIRVR